MKLSNVSGPHRCYVVLVSYWNTSNPVSTDLGLKSIWQLNISIVVSDLPFVLGCNQVQDLWFQRQL